MRDSQHFVYITLKIRGVTIEWPHHAADRSASRNKIDSNATICERLQDTNSRLYIITLITPKMSKDRIDSQ